MLDFLDCSGEDSTCKLAIFQLYRKKKVPNIERITMMMFHFNEKVSRKKLLLEA